MRNESIPHRLSSLESGLPSVVKCTYLKFSAREFLVSQVEDASALSLCMQKIPALCLPFSQAPNPGTVKAINLFKTPLPSSRNPCDSIN
jgi:hypothetical protein